MNKRFFSRKPSKPLFFFSALGLLLGGLLLMRAVLFVFLGLLDGEAVLPRLLDGRGLLGHLVSSLLTAGLWCYLAFRGK